ncbi:MAG: histidine kinase [Chitinophagaceae bacterium]|nr:histidine kinase [Chitinophagaceae bacterium]
MIKQVSFYLLFLLGISLHLNAQNRYVDSLKTWLNQHPEQDTMRVMTTHRLSYRLSEINPQQAWSYAKETELLARQIHFEKGECLANVNYAILESNEGNFKNSADYYLKAIHIAEKINYTRGLSLSYNNIGDNYLKLKQYGKAIEYTQKALALNQSIGEKRAQAINYEQLGSVYFKQGKHREAFDFWEKGYALAAVAQDPNIYCQLIIDRANYYSLMNNRPLAFENLRIADSIASSSNEQLLQILTYKAMATAYEGINSDSIRRYLQKAIAVAKSLGNKTEECDIYLLLATNFEQQKEFDSAFYYLRKHKILGDTVLSDKNFAHLAFVQTQHETELKDKENHQLRSIQVTQKKQINEKNWLLIASLVALFLAILSVFLVYRAYIHNKNRLILEEQKKQSEYNQQLAEMEIKALRSQMNPHFLFNSLNSIRNYIIKNEPQIASNYLANFASLMRKILDASQQSQITLESEIEMLKLYIDLEMLRFSNRFTYKITVDPELENISIHIPSMVIQPFVENAIWHGLLNKEEGEGVLEIRFLEKEHTDKEIICEVVDNGIGRVQSEAIKGSMKKHMSKGINITRERLKRLSKISLEEPIIIEDLYDEHGQACGTLIRLHLPVL